MSFKLDWDVLPYSTSFAARKKEQMILEKEKPWEKKRKESLGKLVLSMNYN